MKGTCCRWYEPARAERGTRCHQEGRCKYPTSYHYDKPIAQAITPQLKAEPSLASSSLWITVTRRWVFLEGCATPAQASRAEKVIRRQADVELVIVNVKSGSPTQGKLPYAAVAQ
jgi:osmotically-inducible protein OsmY